MHSRVHAGTSPTLCWLTASKSHLLQANKLCSPPCRDPHAHLRQFFRLRLVTASCVAVIAALAGVASMLLLLLLVLRLPSAIRKLLLLLCCVLGCIEGILLLGGGGLHTPKTGSQA